MVLEARLGTPAHLGLQASMEPRAFLAGISPTGGDLTLCSYQEKKSTEVNYGHYASTGVSVNEASVGLN